MHYRTTANEGVGVGVAVARAETLGAAVRRETAIRAGSGGEMGWAAATVG